MADIASDLGTLEHENFEHKPFVPFNKLEALFTHDKVLELLEQHDLEFHLIDETVKKSLMEVLKRSLHWRLSKIFEVLRGSSRKINFPRSRWMQGCL